MTGPVERYLERSFFAPWRAMSVPQRWIVSVGIVGLILSLISIRDAERSRKMDLLREQFHLPAGIAFTDFDPGGSKVKWPVIRGTVTFSQTQYDAWVSALDDGKTWRPVPVRYRDVTTIGRYSADALRWRDYRPPPRRRDGGLPDWGIFFEAPVQSIRRGRYFCLAVLAVEPPPSRDDEKRDDRAVSCWELGEQDAPVMVIEGVLDTDTRRLHMKF